LLREDAGFFREHHYLNPLAVDDSYQPMLWCPIVYTFLRVKRESFRFLGLFTRNFCSQGALCLVRLPQFH
jgi:hypothetical protein